MERLKRMHYSTSMSVRISRKLDRQTSKVKLSLKSKTRRVIILVR